MRKLIGKGAFTKAYLVDNHVELDSCCPIKECMAWGWFPDSPLFPKIEWIEHGKYRMKYYPHVSSLKQNLDPDQWEIYKTLRNFGYRSFANISEAMFEWIKIFETLENKELSATLIKAIEACGNYGTDVGFEISPRNVAVDNGKLILLDVFFSISTLRKIRS